MANGIIKIAWLVSVVGLLACPRMDAAALNLIPGVHFVRKGDTVRVRVSLESEDLAFLRLRVSWDAVLAACTADSGEVNPNRVTLSGLSPAFSYPDSHTLEFQADNLGDTSVAAGSGWVFSFECTGKAVGAGAFEIQVMQAQTSSGYTPSPIRVTGGNALYVFDLTGLPPSPTNDRDATITLQVPEGIAAYRYALDDSGYSAAAIPVDQAIQLSNLSDAVHTLSVLVEDSGGAWQDSEQPSRYTWTVDSRVPDNPELAGAAPAMQTPFDPEQTGGVALTWRAESGADHHGYTWILDSSPDTTAPETSVSATPPAALPAGLFSGSDGPYYLHLRTNSRSDGSGFWAATSHFGPWYKDTTPPVAALLVPPPDPDNRVTNIALSVDSGGSDFDRVVEYRYRLDHGAWTNPTPVGTPLMLTGLAPGVTHTLELEGKDPAGNWQAQPSTYSWYVDVTPPEIGGIATAPPPGAYFNAQSPGFEVEIQTRNPAVDTESAVTGYAWVLARGDSAPQPGYAVAGAALPAEVVLDQGDGDYYLGVRAFDAAGNFSGTTVLGPWTVDTQAPGPPSGISVTDPVNAANAAAVALAGRAEAGAEIHYAFTDAGGGRVAGTLGADAAGKFSGGGIDLTPLADGVITLTVFARDPAGNASGVVSRGLSKDTVPPAAPVLTAVSNPVNLGNAASVTLAGLGEAGAELQYAFADSASSPPVTGNLIVNAGGHFEAGGIDVRSLADGTLTLTALARDSAGNESTVTSSAIVKDTVPPRLAGVDWRGPRSFGVCFSEAVGSAAVLAGNYAFSPSLTVNSVDSGEDARHYILHTDWQAPLVSYTLVPGAGITDAAGNPVLADGVGVGVPGYFRIRLESQEDGSGVDLVFGNLVDASAGFDSSFDGVAPAGAPAALTIYPPDHAEGLALCRDFRGIGSDVTRWRLTVAADSGGLEAHWAPAVFAQVAGGDAVYLQRQAGERAAAAAVDMSAEASASLEPGTYRLVRGVLQNAAITLHAGWNLVGFDLVSCQSAVEVFRNSAMAPLHLGPFWGWRNGGYSKLDFLPAESGFWVLRRNSGAPRPVAGIPADGLLVLHQGWNLVCPVSEFSVGGMAGIEGVPWSWDATGQFYRAAGDGVLHPGTAYWLYVSLPELSLDTGSAKP